MGMQMAHESMQTNIEIAHLYSNSVVSDMHHASIRRMKELDIEDSTLSIMVDDYHAKEFSLNVLQTVRALEMKHKIKIGFVAFESSFIDAANEIYLSIKNKNTVRFKKDKKLVDFLGSLQPISLLHRYEKTGETRYDCALLTAAWQLTRLGAFPFKNGMVLNLSDKPMDSDAAISILDKTYTSNEQKSLEIIRNSPYSEYVERIRHEYI